ncbi:MAG TPA: hypothetical protein VGV35_16975 [Bryobacteraceae bacterium]|nr:hypothetical protein [Bryobacteraceae bacterium]
MADNISRVDHYSTTIPNKVGEGARVLGALRDGGVNLIALWAYPESARQAQLEMIPASSAGFAQAAKKAGLKVGKKQTAFFINGEDRPGALVETFSKLAGAGTNIDAVKAVCGGAGRYGAIILVPQKDIRRASRALGVS